ncbi:MAG: ankyrin repeat domain-containing protein [bacterium]|nr:ankyrin repeat domain-containing protein [bacterium]
MQLIPFILTGVLVLAGAAGTGPSADGSGGAPSVATLVGEGRLDELQQTIHEGLPPEAGLMAAVRHDSEDALRLVLQLGADPKGLQASRALLRARRQGLDRTARILTEAGANLEGRDPYGRTLLILALEEEPVSRVQAIASAGADVNATSNVGTTALMAAVVSGWPRKVKTLLRSGADIEAEDRDGWTALSWAVRMEAIDIMRLLLARGADPDHVDRLGWTPLLLASAQANPAVVHELLARGASPNLKTPTVGTPLIRAVHGGDPEVLRQLLVFGADRRPLYGGRNAFGWAKSLGRSELAQMLEWRGPKR